MNLLRFVLQTISLLNWVFVLQHTTLKQVKEKLQVSPDSELKPPTAETPTQSSNEQSSFEASKKECSARKCCKNQLESCTRAARSILMKAPNPCANVVASFSKLQGVWSPHVCVGSVWIFYFSFFHHTTLIVHYR